MGGIFCVFLKELQNWLFDPSQSWLGHYSGRVKVRRAGLWNNRHVDETHDPAFLRVLEALIQQIPVCYQLLAQE